MHTNLAAFLAMIRYSEIGPALLAKSDNGYNVIVGGELFKGYADHPRKLVEMRIKGVVVRSTAAGAYQVLERFFDFYKRELQLVDFGKASQDRIAIRLISECKAMPDIEAGRFADAVYKCRSRWASLPGADYNQHENRIGDLAAAYQAAGGSIA